MSDTQTQTATTSGTFLLFLVFLTLKLTGVIDWSWWWITAPLWAPAVIAGLVIGMMFAVMAIRKARK